MDDHQEFLSARTERIHSYPRNPELKRTADAFLVESVKRSYSYNFDWLGLPVIQYPQDLMALQEIIWRTDPDCIVETGVARGGSLAFYASMLDLLRGDGFVVGIDIDIRPHNKKRIMDHPLSKRIRLLEGSSIEESTATQLRLIAHDRQRIMLCLDSNHTHSHVLRELELYAPLVAQGCYCVVFDTVIEAMPEDHFRNRPWNKGNNPKTAVASFLESIAEARPLAEDGAPLVFEVDREIDAKLMLSVASGGYLRRIETPRS